MAVYGLELAILFWSIVEAAQRSRHRSFALDGSHLTVNISVGTPAQYKNARLETTLTHFMVMDVECMDPGRRCPRYCGDDIIRPTFCSPLCGEFSSAEVLARCGTEDFYLPNASTTFVSKRTEVEWRFRNHRPLTGRLALESVSVNTEKPEKINTGFYRRWEAFSLRGLEFLRGFRFDQGQLNTLPALLGLAPRSLDGQISLIPELKARGVLDRAILTIHLNNEPLLMSGFSQVSQGLLMTAGALNKYHCMDWRHFPAYSDTDWDFVMTRIRFEGMEFNGKQIGRIDMKERPITVPENIVKQMVKANIVTVDTEGFIWLRNFTKVPTVEFSNGDQTMLLNSYRLQRKGNQLNMKVGKYVRYTDERRWVFGNYFVQGACYGYDYDRRRVMMATRRRSKINLDYS